LVRSKSGAWKSRKRLPEDVRLQYQELYGPAWEVKLTIPATTAPEKAKAEHIAWLAEVEGRVATLRAGKRGRGQDLNQREADALAGEWYRWFTAQHLDNPGPPVHWTSLHEDLIWEAAYRNPETSEFDLDVPEVWAAVTVDGRTAEFLIDRGLTLSEDGQRLFLTAVGREFLYATRTLERRSRGDWSEDQHLDQLAAATAVGEPHGLRTEAFALPATQAASSQKNGCTDSVAGVSVLRRSGAADAQLRSATPSAAALFEAYCQDKRRAASTVNRWRCVFAALDALPPHEAVKDADGAQQWLDGLVGTGTPPRSHRTVKDVWLSAARTVFAWAVRKRRVAINPFEGCTVDVPRTIETRETGKEFTEAEAQTILRASMLVEAPGARGAEWAAARRWVPWLCAYTGARVGELTQLRVQDIEFRQSNARGPLAGAEYPVLRITPEAGTVKTRKTRVVPIHAHLVEMGLLEYVEVVKARLGQQGPLFFRPPARPSRNPNYRGPAIKARERLAEWVRDLGVDDPGIQPNHAWRHSFKRRAARAKIEPRIRDAVCGHTSRTQAERYELPTVEDVAAALIAFPRWEVS
jgi:integrase